MGGICVSYAVQHHPSRAALLERITVEAEIVTDPDPDGKRNPWRTYRECLARTPEWCTHRVVLQDDVILPPRFEEMVEEAISDCDCKILVLFASSQLRRGTVEMYRAASRGDRYALLHSQEWVPAVAVVWPSDIPARVVAWADQQRYSHRVTADDAVLGAACRAMGLEVYATVPCLVEHPDDTESLMGWKQGRRHPRTAVLPPPGL